MKFLAIALIGAALLCVVQGLPRYRSPYLYPSVPWTVKSQSELVNELNPERPDFSDLVETPNLSDLVDNPDLELELPELPQLPDLVDHPELCRQLQEALCDVERLTCEEEGKITVNGS